MYKVTDRDLVRWKKLAEVVTDGNEYYSGDVLSNVLLKLDVTKVRDNLDGLVFISLKNAYLDILRAEKSKKKREANFKEEYLKNNFEEEDEYNEEVDLETQRKLNLISECYDKVFDTFEKQLYYIYFIKKMSERAIVEETGISRYTIRLKIADIKNKIKDYVTKNS